MITASKHFLIVTILSCLVMGCHTEAKKTDKPNIVIFLADDLGYGEIGAYGQEKIHTPHMDQLAANGMKFTQHYSGAPVCAPARCILLTGKHAGHALVRGNDEWAARGEVWDYKKAFEDPNLEGQRPLPENTTTIASLLKESGYTTGVFGKWGLGGPLTEGIPTKQGFDEFYGYNCQRQAHNLTPGHLWENEEKVILNNEIIPPRTLLDSLADPYDKSSYAKYNQSDYAPTLIHDKALTFVKKNKDKPFFLFYASPLPHLPLQAPQELVDTYTSELGSEEPYLGDKGYFPNHSPRASYAAMITYLDQQLGELVATLKETGQYENTLILLTSDNGPTYTGGVDFNYFESSKPLTNGYGRTKGFVYEGGVRVPMIASWPSKIRAGTISDHTSIFYDYLPTLCDIAGIQSKESTDGISFKSALLEDQEQIKHDFLYWEFPSYKGQQAVRMGKWKGIRKNIFEGNMHIELYDLDNDLTESNDISEEHPVIVAQIAAIMLNQHTPSKNKRFQFEELGD